MKSWIFASLSALAFASAVAAPADLPPALGQHHLDHLDSDRDQRVSGAEFERFMSSAFDQLDTDRDGSLRAEDTRHVLTAEQFGQVDADRNGRISRAEFLGHVKRDFARADKGRDNRLH